MSHLELSPALGSSTCVIAYFASISITSLSATECGFFVEVGGGAESGSLHRASAIFAFSVSFIEYLFFNGLTTGSAFNMTDEWFELRPQGSATSSSSHFEL